MTALVRISAGVPLARAEEARAAALELAPAGFEETETADLLTLSFYVEESAVAAIRARLSRSRDRTGRRRAGRTAGVRSTGRPGSAASGSGRPGSSPGPTSSPS